MKKVHKNNKNNLKKENNFSPQSAHEIEKEIYR
jgi:hypothetical protein